MALDKFPVDESALPRVTISKKKLDEWREVAHDELQRALANKHSWYNAFKDKIRDGYEMIADKPNLKAFIRGIPSTNDKNVLVRATFDNVTLDDIAYGSYCESTFDVRCAFAHMYEDNFLDGAILHVHETKTVDDPLHFVGVKWIAFRSPAPAIVTSRDFVFFSYEGFALDANGHRVLFRFLRTMPMEDVPVDSSKLPPLVRGKISNLHFYRQNGSHVEAYVKAMHSNAGNMPSWVVTKTIAFMYPGVTNMETLGDAKALMRQGLTRLNPSRISSGQGGSPSSSFSSSSSSVNGSRAPASLASANACGVCYHKFKMTRSKRQCHGCARTVCKRCTRGMYFFDEQKQMSTTGIARLRFCHNCIKHARSEASYARQSADSSMDTNRSDNLRALATDNSGVGKNSGGSSHSLHRVSSQEGSLHRLPSQASSGDGSFRGASSNPNDGLRYMPRVLSSDSISSIPRTPSLNSMGRAPSQDGSNPSMSQSNPSLSQSTLSYSRTQPEVEYSDGEDVPYEDGYTPPPKPVAATQPTKSTTVFASSKVSNAYDGSPINEHPITISQSVNPLESSHVGQYSNFKIQALAGDSEDEGDDEDEDFGDFHDSDSEDDVLADVVAARHLNDDIDGSSEYDFDDIGDIVDHKKFEYPDPDEYSVAGSFSYDVGAPSFMSSLHDESFSYEPGVSYDPTNATPSYNDGSRGSFVPLTLVDTPSIVAQVAAGRQPPVITPQLRQHQQQQQHTLRTYGHPAAVMPPTLDETSEFDGASVPPPPSPTMLPLNKNVARTGSTPNLLAYGSTKRTNRPGGAGMAPVRRAVSSEARTPVNGDMNDLSNGFSARLNLQSTPEMAAASRKQPGFNPSASGGSSSTSPLIRYYGS